MTCQIIYLADKKRERDAANANLPLSLVWPALITSCVLCWGIVAVTAIHVASIFHEVAVPPR